MWWIEQCGMLSEQVQDVRAWMQGRRRCCKRRACALSLGNLAARAGANMDAASKDQNAPVRAPI